jgi:hypothetical protein
MVLFGQFGADEFSDVRYGIHTSWNLRGRFGEAVWGMVLLGQLRLGAVGYGLVMQERFGSDNIVKFGRER